MNTYQIEHEDNKTVRIRLKGDKESIYQIAAQAATYGFEVEEINARENSSRELSK
jgi:hypothetical protein